jgi:5-methylcytosine-specific restriction protein B
VFERRDGVLLRLCERILQTGKRHVLILDEMNRGDLPLIFGELMYLLSRRGKRAPVCLAKSGRQLDLPDLLSIIGTMNTADRSISHVDFALRRRFRFFRVAPEPRVIEAIVGPRQGPAWAASLSRLLSETNDLLGRTGRGFEIGHSYLLDVDGPEALREVWDREVLPTIEDWLDFDPRALKPFALDRLLKKVEREDSSAGAAEGEGVDEPT